ncbi:MAG TPA: IS21 family transposase [Vicinamibacterales bacterium]|nr:IS21 family transposase [Vicinamibacterales bacterium]
MTVTDAQVRKLRAEMAKTGLVDVSAMRAGMHRNTASKYLKTDDLPSEQKTQRGWRTRMDAFEQDWSWIAEMLRDAPRLEAKTLFEDLVHRHPGRYQPGQLRTLQRRVKQWRAEDGPEKELFFPQQHVPGEAMQTDFTWMTSLGITIAGEAYAHLLCHSVLPYSDWSWGTPCLSESMAALRKSVPAALMRLGRRPKFHQTDNSTAATHRLDKGKRGFNDDYCELIEHLGMQPRTIKVGAKEQNGDVEAGNGAVKRFVAQQLMLRGNREFATHDDYTSWLHEVFDSRNRSRGARLEEELAVMEPFTASAVPEYTEVRVRVTGGGTIRVKTNTYSVPSRLKDEWVRVRVYDERLEVCYADKIQLTVERLVGRSRHRINYRHVVHSMVRKPGAFRHYRFRDDLFPTDTFRRAFERLDAAMPERRADLEYLRILELAANTMESAVEQVLVDMLTAGAMPCAESIRSRVAATRPEVPDLPAPTVELAAYDEHLVGLDTEVQA